MFPDRYHPDPPIGLAVKLFTQPNPIARTFARGLSLLLAFGLAAAPLPTLAAPPEEEAPPEEVAASEAIETPMGTGNVAILKFDGDEYKANDFRARVQAGLSAQGYTANFIKRSIDEAAQKNKCKATDNGCLEKIGAYLNKNSSVAYDYYVWATVPAEGEAKLEIYDVKGKKTVVEMSMFTSANDFILAEVIGTAVARRLVETQVAPTPATEGELAMIATLDEPKETPEEIAAREKALTEAMDQAGKDFSAGVDVGAQAVDLEADFKQYCRTGPREDKEVEGDDGEVSKERDLRPACKRGPVFGYWQPRAWVALTLTLGSAATMGTMWGLAAAAKSNWSKARDNLQASGLSATDPNNACADGVCYQDLAGEVSDYTAQVRRRAIVGDVFLGATVLLTGVLAIIIYQDRQAAKDFIGREKELRALSNLRIAPVFGTTNGLAMGFEF